MSDVYFCQHCGEYLHEREVEKIGSGPYQPGELCCECGQNVLDVEPDELLDYAKGLRNGVEVWRKNAVSMECQRNQLLEALEGLLEALDKHAASSFGEAEDKARQAIATVKEDK